MGIKRLWAVFLALMFGNWILAAPVQKRKAAPARRPAAPRVQISPDQIDSPTDQVVDVNSKGASVIRAQILLAQKHFSPGEIELSYNGNLKSAITAFQTAYGLQPTGIVDHETWQALESQSLERETQAQESTQGLDRPIPSPGNSDAGRVAAAGEAAVLVTYTITKEDTEGPFIKMPRARNAEELMLRKAQLPSLDYTSLREKLGEKFHISPGLLAQLNPRKNFSRTGETILVPKLPQPLSEKVNLVVVDASDHGVTAISQDGRVIAFYPATMGSDHDPLPLGEWKITGVSLLPKFHYDPRLFWDAKNKNAKAILPPGPNSPVGKVWIDLSKEHYGIHGTPEPSLIGKTESHGCIRLTNWDVEELAKMVAPGIAAILQE